MMEGLVVGQEMQAAVDTPADISHPRFVGLRLQEHLDGRNGQARLSDVRYIYLMCSCVCG